MKTLDFSELPYIFRKKKYQCIFSLGGSCAAAFQLKFRGLRKESLPFDWLYHLSNEALSRLALCFQEDFVHWLQKENLQKISEKIPHPNQNLKYRDTYTGFCFIHDFKVSLDKEYVAVKEKYNRRIKRLYEKISAAQNVLVILSVFSYPIEMDDLAPIRKILATKFPKAHFDFVIVRYSAKQESLTYDNNCYLVQTKRSEGGYDYTKPTFEYSFLDNIIDDNKKSILSKIFYKIRKKIEKKTAKKNAQYN